MSEKKLSQSFGPYGSRVRIFRNVDGGPIWMALTGAPKPIDLKTRDWPVATKRAWSEVANLKKGHASAADPVLTIRQAVEMYLNAKGIDVSRGQDEANERCTPLWLNYLGPDTPVRAIKLADAHRFMQLRMSGVVDGRNQPVPENKRRLVSEHTAAGDVLWLRTVLNHVLKEQDEENGPVWLRANPLRKFEWTRNPTPRRPVCDEARFKKIVKAADRVKMQVTWTGKRKKARAPIRELIELAAFTGARIGAIVKLRHSDLRLERRKDAPYGYILFPGNPGRINKNPTPWEAVLTKESRPTVDRLVVEYLLREPHAADDPGYLFPSPDNLKEYLPEDFANVLHGRAERLAKLDHLRQGIFHSYRRKHDTELAHISPTVAASTTGRKDINTMLRSYVQVPRAAKYAALRDRRPLKAE